MTFRPKPEPSVERVFSEAERTAIYDVIYHRRDVRNEFKPDPLDPTVLERMLKAAHAAPSVGLSQPWRFILIRDPARRSKIKQAFERANAEAREMFSDNKKQEYAALKLEGIASLAAGLGAERFVLDDGWFGSRDDDTQSLGIRLTCAKPKGSPSVMSFGLWFEPEMVNQNSLSCPS